MILRINGNIKPYYVQTLLMIFFPGAKFPEDEEETPDTVVASVDMTEDGGYVSAEVTLRQGEKKAFAATRASLDGDADKKRKIAVGEAFMKAGGDFTSVTAPWGILTGVRPAKVASELMRGGCDAKTAAETISREYFVSPVKSSLAVSVAEAEARIITDEIRRECSVYIGIPFCPTRCSYCSFVSHSMDSAIKLMPQYVEALCRELEIIGKMVKETQTSIDTIYFGGGTPTSISASDLRTIMECVEKNFDLSAIREYSVEAGRPDTITEEKLRVIKELGADRISVNPQTLNDDVLRVIGRKHSGSDAIKAFELARKIGFDNINTDLIAGLPTESAESFRNTLDKITELSPESITVHTLTIKRSADLFKNGSANSNNPAAEMVDYSIEKLMNCGYLPYYMYRQKNTVDNLENVGYAKSGFESFYNIFIMDETQTILGAGCAASTKLVYPNGLINRIHNYKFPYEYISSFDKLMEKKTEAEKCLRILKNK